MGSYQLGQDANGHPLTEDQFYMHVKKREVIKLFRDAAGFRVEYGPDGGSANIFDLKEGKNYRPMTQEDFEKEISNSKRRKVWLENGLAAILKTGKTSEQPEEDEGMHLQHHHQDTGHSGPQTSFP
ncbi:hypothetical protein A3K73_06920 [Candidatus Pacearchaeota archaeon RBG_13_36_9]|nr:MAG: hypothetical protein A3K73_06920 [Candidatus Pacearchaeota archaeon RBG_13_36_9]